MAERPSNVDQWLGRETPRIRKALESASRYFDAADDLTVNTLEAVYGQESSFGALLGTRGSTKAAGHFQLQPETAKRYGLSVSKNNDHRFDVDDASSAAARYLKDLDSMFSKDTTLSRGKKTIAVKCAVERKKFVLAAYSGGEGRIAGAQRLAEDAGRNPQQWSDVQQFLEPAGADEGTAQQIRGYIQRVIPYEMEFAQKSLADKDMKHKDVRKEPSRCTEGHWVTIDGQRVFICD
jgi:membrane-bound lytic murein transglycosylase MltF